MCFKCYVGYIHDVYKVHNLINHIRIVIIVQALVTSLVIEY